ncbi:MAG: hypothetical protein BWY82_01751 [Verrucomicrobia bacterium ADurb.Bin474]|nr:MAG: hypothetical protein BWY82_01751 [Verrucomicrobia bacterium ADurb.Bin474]
MVGVAGIKVHDVCDVVSRMPQAVLGDRIGSRMGNALIPVGGSDCDDRVWSMGADRGYDLLGVGLDLVAPIVFHRFVEDLVDDVGRVAIATGDRIEKGGGFIGKQVMGMPVHNDVDSFGHTGID